MDTIAKVHKAIILGRTGENERDRVLFPITDLVEELGEDVEITLLHKRSGDDVAYVVPTVERTEEHLIWTVTSGDTETQGKGECELIARVNGVVAKTLIWSTVVMRSLDGGGKAPSGWEYWLEQFEQQAEAAETSATEAATYAENAAAMAGDAEESSKRAQTAREAAEAAAAQVTGLVASAETLEPGSAATAQYDAQTGVLALGIPRGETGAAGPQGDPGEDYILTEADKAEIAGLVAEPVHISGSTPTITCLPGTRYICGEVSAITVIPPASGCVDVVFASGSAPAVLTVTPPAGMTMRWANGFDPGALEADTTYEINILDGYLGVAAAWT